MGTIRTALKWIARHRALSAGVAVALAGLAVAGRLIASRSAGELSAPLARGTIIESVYGIGTVTARKSYQIRPGVIGTISELFVREGDSVRKGDRLARLDTVLYSAPFAGTVAFLPFKIGENVFPQLPVLVLVDLEDRYLVVSLEQQGALRVEKGQKARMSFDSMREQSFDGVVEAVYSYNGGFLARVDVSRLPVKILPDMTADVAIEIGRRENALLAPVAALDQGALWIKRGHGIPFAARVKTGVVDKDMAEIVSGDVQAGDRVLIRKKTGP